MISLEKHFPFIVTYRKPIIGLLIFLSFSAAGFHMNDKGSEWFWTDQPLIAITLILLSLVLSFLLVEEARNNRSLAEQQIIKLNSVIHELSKRQLEVFKLVVAGKTNKEICALLFIESSTLKTHINQIYKTLGIKNRKEAIRIGQVLL